MAPWHSSVRATDTVSGIGAIIKPRGQRAKANRWLLFLRVRMRVHPDIARSH